MSWQRRRDRGAADRGHSACQGTELAQNGPFWNKMLGSWGEEADNREMGWGAHDRSPKTLAVFIFPFITCLL